MNHAAQFATNEIPSDEEVVGIVQQYREGIDASQLVRKLTDSGHERPNSQRAVQRALSRGRIKLGQGLRLIAVTEAIAA